jgi:hypothetical protein
MYITVAKNIAIKSWGRGTELVLANRNCETGKYKGTIVPM